MILKRLVIALFVLAACPSQVGDRESAPRSPESAYREARQLRREGNLLAARKVTERELSTLATQPNSVIYCKFRLLESELLEDLGDRVRAAKYRDAYIPDSPEFGELIARQRMDQARARFVVSDYARARTLLDEAAAIARKNGYRELLSSIEGVRGAVFVRLGLLPEAEASFRASLRLAYEAGDSQLRASALGNLGFLALNAARFDDCIGWLEQTVAESKSKSYLALAEQNLGWCYYRLGDVDRALALTQDAERLSREMGNVYEQQVAIGHIGNAHYAKGEFRAALADYERAVKLARDLKDKYYLAKWLNDLATTWLEMGNVSAAEKYNNEALTLQEGAVARLWPLINAARIHQQRNEFAKAESLYREAAEARVDDPAPRLDAQARLADLLATQGRAKDAEAQFQNALALVEHSRAKLDRDESKLSYFESLIRLYRDYVEFLFAQNRTEEALLVAESSRARLLSEKMHGRAGARFTGSIAGLQRVAQRSGTVLLSYWLAPSRSILWMIAPSGVLGFSLPPDRQIRGLVEAHARSILDLRDPLENGESPARKLYDVLLGPVANYIPPGTRVAIVPDGWLHDLNFETLAAGGEKPHYWIDDVTVSVLPSLGVLLNARPAMRRGFALLLIGDPIPANERQFPKLAHAGREIASIARQFAASRIVARTGEAAVPGAYSDADPRRFSMIHFAAHAAANRESPLDSAVILTPSENLYRLYAREIIRRPIHAELVTISACHGAGARTYGGEGLVGFAWAFLEAGARNVVAGLWEVDDASTATIMERMYREIHNGDQPADALRAAKLSILHSGGVVRKPYYWAPFETFTGSL